MSAVGGRPDASQTRLYFTWLRVAPDEIEIQNCTASELVNPHAFVRDFDGHFSRHR
jgi:hypothetical protein